MSHEPHDKLEGPTWRLVELTDGDWAGWSKWDPVDDFEVYVGPFYCRRDERGVVCGFMPETKNRNGGGNIHGGALMTFADYALFIIAGGMEETMHGVTLSMNCDFIGAAEPGRLLTARGEVTRKGGTVVFVRGMIEDEGRAVLGFSGTIRRFR